METVLITGANGLIGSTLTPMLQQRGYRVMHLSRNLPEKPKVETFLWDIKKQTIDNSAIEQADYIVHLAGANLADKRWTNSQKKEIIDSRVDSLHLLFKSIQKTDKHLRALVSASGTGIYGAITTEKIFQESDLPAEDFLGNTCKLWEGAAETIAKLDIRTVKIRTGVVLAEKEGALAKMAKPIELFVGSPLGSGKQYIPWIHLDDICAVYIKAIEDDSLHGAYNAVAPEHVTNKAFTKAIAKVLHRPLVIPNVPSFLLKIIFGELANAVLEGSRVSCKKLEKKGFTFKYDTLDKALHNLLKAS
jgi:uncharacterized protein (TIGR01777 family)